jgi:isobutyryl-CoA mutase
MLPSINNAKNISKANGLEALVESKLKAKWEDKGLARPRYQGELPEGNDGLGFMLLGITGDEVLEPRVYDEIQKEIRLAQVRGTVQADISEGRSGSEHLYFLHRVCTAFDGRRTSSTLLKTKFAISILYLSVAITSRKQAPILSRNLAFTLANGFTYVEYYLSRGMDINEFGPNLSFIFLQQWSGSGVRSHWPCSSAHLVEGALRKSTAQCARSNVEVSHSNQRTIACMRRRSISMISAPRFKRCMRFMTIAILLHTNAYDEAITTPTEESVRRAMAIQLIINKELGLAKNENPLARLAFIIDQLTDLVEEAVLF